MPNCDSYGISAGFAAVCAGISWFLVQNRSCKINVVGFFSSTLDEDNLQFFHYSAIIIGMVLFILSFLDLAAALYKVRLLFVTAIMGILASGAMMLYATYVAFLMPCQFELKDIFDTASLAGARNVIEAKDEVGISIMTLDLICALALISAAIGFSRSH